jgi:hypothetical protein
MAIPTPGETSISSKSFFTGVYASSHSVMNFPGNLSLGKIPTLDYELETPAGEGYARGFDGIDDIAKGLFILFLVFCAFEDFNSNTLFGGERLEMLGFCLTCSKVYFFGREKHRHPGEFIAK